MNVNKAIVVGRITQDLELKATPSGQSVLAFGLATNRSWKDKDGNKQESTQFHNIVVWGKRAEVIAQYCSKGQELYIEGRMETRSWEGDDGRKNYRTEVIAENFEFGQRAGGDSANQSTNQAAPQDSEPTIQYPEEDIDPDDIPF